MLSFYEFDCLVRKNKKLNEGVSPNRAAELEKLLAQFHAQYDNQPEQQAAPTPAPKPQPVQDQPADPYLTDKRMAPGLNPVQQAAYARYLKIVDDHADWQKKHDAEIAQLPKFSRLLMKASKTTDSLYSRISDHITGLSNNTIQLANDLHSMFDAMESEGWKNNRDAIDFMRSLMELYQGTEKFMTVLQVYLKKCGEH